MQYISKKKQTEMLKELQGMQYMCHSFHIKFIATCQSCKVENSCMKEKSKEKYSKKNILFALYCLKDQHE